MRSNSRLKKKKAMQSNIISQKYEILIVSN